MRKFRHGCAPGARRCCCLTDEVWELWTDWGGFNRWWIQPEDGGRRGPRIASVKLVGDPNEVPRTRVVRHETSSVVDEPLLIQNDETRRFYYDMVPWHNGGGAVLRAEFENYLATTMVEALPDGQTVMTFKSAFDPIEKVRT